LKEKTPQKGNFSGSMLKKSGKKIRTLSWLYTLLIFAIGWEHIFLLSQTLLLMPSKSWC